MLDVIENVSQETSDGADVQLPNQELKSESEEVGVLIKSLEIKLEDRVHERIKAASEPRRLEEARQLHRRQKARRVRRERALFD